MRMSCAQAQWKLVSLTFLNNLLLSFSHIFLGCLFLLDTPTATSIVQNHTLFSSMATTSKFFFQSYFFFRVLTAKGQRPLLGFTWEVLTAASEGMMGTDFVRGLPVCGCCYLSLLHSSCILCLPPFPCLVSWLVPNVDPWLSSGPKRHSGFWFRSVLGSLLSSEQHCCFPRGWPPNSWFSRPAELLAWIVFCWPHLTQIHPYPSHLTGPCLQDSPL